MTWFKFKTTLSPASLAGFFGLLWFIYYAGVSPLLPTHTAWLQIGDWSQHYLGWSFFRNEPITLPLGTITRFGVGTTVGFMDSNPWVCLLLRPFAVWLPLHVQFIGLWLALCFVLQGVFGARIAETFLEDRVAIFLCACLFVISPPLLARLHHDTLVAHWLLLAGIWLCLVRDATPRDVRRRRVWIQLLMFYVAGTHPYLAAMLAPLLVIALLRRWYVDRTLHGGALAAHLLGLVVSALSVFWLFGYIGSGVDPASVGFGEYCADLFAFINPDDWSRFLPALPRTGAGYEGFAYLGVGGLILCAGAATLRIAARNSMRTSITWRALIALGIFCTAFAVSDIVHAGGREVLSLRPWTGPLVPLFAVLRASARFIWLPYYLLFAGSCAVLAKGVHKRSVLRWLLGSILVLQLIDLAPAGVREEFVRAKPNPLVSPAWRLMAGDYHHLAMYPPYFDGFAADCDHEVYAFDEYAKFALRAYEAHMSINSAYLARADGAKIRAYCNSFRAAVATGTLDDDTVYAVQPGEAALFTRQQAHCAPADGILLCVTPHRTTRLSTWINQ